MKTLFKPGSIILLIFPALSFFSGCKVNEADKINNQISEISRTYVPDNRTDICNINATFLKGDTVLLTGETTVTEAKSAIIKSLDDYGKFLIDSISILPDTSVNPRYMGLSTLSVINLRKEPDHSSELVSQALMGTPVMILKKDHSWLLVRTPDRYISWTEQSSVRPVSLGEMSVWKNSDRIVFEKNSGWVFTNIAETGVVSDLVSGCIMARTGDARTYARVMLPDGREGFVVKSSIFPFDQFLNRDSVSGEKIINQASSLMGVPYLWGGSSAKGVDCSGLVQTVFFMNGLVMSRDASQQALYGDSIDISRDFSSLKSGDLLFFGRPDRISHVAIYKGGGEYIHASGRVMVNSLDSTESNYSSYRKNSLVKALRILNSPDPGIVPVIKHPWY